MLSLKNNVLYIHGNFRSDLDDLSEAHDHFQDRFTVALNVFVTDTERKPTQPAPWQTDQTKRLIDTMFTSQIEKEETVDNFGENDANVGLCGVF